MGALWQMTQLAVLMNNQWKEPKRLQQIQWQKLQTLLRHAYTHVPYYRRIFTQNGITPDDIKTPEDFTDIPVTTKLDIRNLGEEELLAGNIEKHQCVKERTSGSSGIPVDFFFTRQEIALRPVLDLRILFANGYKVKKTILAIVDARHVLNRTRWFQRLGLMRKEHLSILSPVEEQIEKIQRMKPDVLWGVTSNLVLIAEQIQQRHITGIHPQAVYTMGEYLDPHRRALLRSAFGVDPLDHYGSTECGSIAWECSHHTGYHINSDTLLLECVTDGKPVKPGESGELVVTNLHACAMPFIRYAVGDIGTLSESPCPCGRTLPVLKTIEGRQADCLLRADGTRIAPYFLTCAIEEIPGILRYQIIQESQQEVNVNIIRTSEYSPQTLSRIEQQCKGVLGERVHVKPVVVDSLQNDPSGKFRVVTSHVTDRETKYIV